MKTLLKCALVFVLPLAGYAADNLPSAPEPRPGVVAVVPAKPAIVPQSPERPTFDRQTVVELGLVAGSLAGDAVSTGLTLNGRYYEQNALARPFVQSAGGSAAYFGMSFSAIVYGNHLLRNHPRWKHTLNWSIIALESYATAHNARM